MAETRPLWPALVLALAAGGANAQDGPLSAIDWLSDSVATRTALPIAPALPVESPAVRSALPESVTVEPLDRPDPAAAGLMRPESVGLPRALWAGATARDVIEALPKRLGGMLPANRQLLVTLLTVEQAPPGTGGTALLTARIDMLLAMGDLPRAARLMEAAGLTDPEIFRRWFDAELLTNNGNRACSRLRALPDISPTYSARIFCLARGGDWNAAALTLETGEALGVITAEEGTLLAHFLDPELFEGEPPLPLPDAPTPLSFAMFEAIGQPIPTARLPLAFAHADLRPVSGWKARLNAAERLARAGALPPDRLFAVYGERKAAASGGIWERVAAVRALDEALADETVTDLGPLLNRAWAEMQGGGLADPFAEAYASGLLALPVDSVPQDLVARIGLLSGAYAHAAARLGSGDPLASLAQGRPPQTAGSTLLAALGQGFDTPDAPEEGSGDAAPGLDMLHAIGLIEEGRTGNYSSLSAGLALMSRLGLAETARRAALEIALADDPA